MTTLVDLLINVENAAKKGFKKGLWLPHKSLEGGNSTIAYGHKLDDKEQAGNFIRLPDGTKHSLKDGGLTEEQAQLLLRSDIQEHKMVARQQWDEANSSTPFEELPPMYQDTLTEIAFNIGTLKGKSGKKFNWPKLAKAIKDKDLEEAKKEISRSFNGKKLSTRNKLVREFMDNHERTSESAVQGDVESSVRENIQAQLGQEAALELTQESLTAEEEDILQLMENPPALEERLSEEEEAILKLLEEREGRLARKATVGELSMTLDALEADRVTEEEEERVLENLWLSGGTS